MKASVKYIVALVLSCALIALAVIGYNYLSGRYGQDDQLPEESVPDTVSEDSSVSVPDDQSEGTSENESVVSSESLPPQDDSSDGTSSENEASVNENSADAVSKDTASKDTVSKDTVSKDTVSKDTTSKDTTSKDTVSKDTTSKDTVSKDTVSKDTVSKDTVSKDTTSRDTTSKDTVSKDTVSEDTVSKDTTSKDTVSKDTVSEDTVSKDTTSKDTVSKDTVSKDTVSEDTVSKEPPKPPVVKTADFTVKDYNGREVSLSDYFGKPIVINFWATWCGPCKSELPAFNKLYAQYKDDVVFMMVNLTDGARDTVTKVKSFVSDGGYVFPVYFDTEYNAAIAYGVSSIPYSVFVNADGSLAASHIGSMTEATLLRYIKGITGE